MTHKERIIGDPKGITRRQVVKGAVTAAVALILSTSVGGIALSAFEKAKNYIGNRKNGLYGQDASMTLRTSHTNPEILELYKSYLSPGSVQPATTELSHRLLHTKYGEEALELAEELKRTPVTTAETETQVIMAKIS